MLSAAKSLTGTGYLLFLPVTLSGLSLVAIHNSDLPNEDIDYTSDRYGGDVDYSI